MPPRIGTGTAACFLVGWWGLRWLERRLCGAVVAAVPRKRSGNRRCVSWLEGTGCGGTAGFSFGERRVRTRFPSPPLFAAIARCLRFRSSPPASPLPVIISSSAVACTPAASHPPHQLPATPPPVSPPPVSPPPATSAADCVLTACVSTVCRFSSLVITTCRPPLPPAACLLPPSPACHHPLLPAPPPLPPAATARRNSCLPPPLLSAICHHPLPAISAAMRRPGGQMGCGGTPRGRSGRDASPARSSAK